MQQTLYLYDICDDELGEAQAFYTLAGKKLTLVTGWSLNDAEFREEYMAGLMKHLGAVVKQLPEKCENTALKQAKAHFGW